MKEDLQCRDGGGYYFHEIIGPNEIEMVYLQVGNDAAVKPVTGTRIENLKKCLCIYGGPPPPPMG